jgi:hypothetical protein
VSTAVSYADRACPRQGGGSSGDVGGSGLNHLTELSSYEWDHRLSFDLHPPQLESFLGYSSCHHSPLCPTRCHPSRYLPCYHQRASFGCIAHSDGTSRWTRAPERQTLPHLSLS